jgi:hypothetical protein
MSPLTWTLGACFRVASNQALSRHLDKLGTG